MSVSIRDILYVLEQTAPRSLQEEWDNSGLLVDSNTEYCTGVMLALDVTPSVVEQAITEGCNLIIAHHPVIFKGLKSVDKSTQQGVAIIKAIKADIAIYCAHTSLDNAPAPYGVSAVMAEMVGCKVSNVLSPSGTGVIAECPTPLNTYDLIDKVKNVFAVDNVRTSIFQPETVSKIAFGGGACGFLIPDAIQAGAQAIVTSDVRYHEFLDYGSQILIIDLTHFDTEKCTKDIFRRIISQKIPKFAQVFCASEINPIEYK